MDVISKLIDILADFSSYILAFFTAFIEFAGSVLSSGDVFIFVLIILIIVIKIRKII